MQIELVTVMADGSKDHKIVVAESVEAAVIAERTRLKQMDATYFGINARVT